MDALINRRRFRRRKINRRIKELPYLPQEIIEDILVRLPVESLERFKYVSKLWFSLITSSRFIKAHFEKSSSDTSFTNHKVITGLHAVQQWPLPSLLYEPSARAVEYKCPTYSSQPPEFVGCCDGLVCILVDEIDFILWNPSTKTVNFLPAILSTGVNLVMYGFGYDECSDDYRVFGLLGGNMSGMGKVYSLKTDSWTIANERIKVNSPVKNSGKFVSGKLHWVVKEMTEEPTVKWDISSFDLENQRSGLVELPEHMDDGFNPFVGVLKGCLCLICDYGAARLDVWIMKQYNVNESWYKMVTLPYPKLRNAPFMDPLFVGANGEILFVCGSSFVVYHPRDARFSHPHLIDLEVFEGVDVYVESLVSPVPAVRTSRTTEEIIKLLSLFINFRTFLH